MNAKKKWFHLGKPAAQTAVRSHVEVAKIMTDRGFPMTRSAVEQTERRAIYKMRLAMHNEGNESE